MQCFSSTKASTPGRESLGFPCEHPEPAGYCRSSIDSRPTTGSSCAQTLHFPEYPTKWRCLWSQISIPQMQIEHAIEALEERPRDTYASEHTHLVLLSPPTSRSTIYVDIEVPTKICSPPSRPTRGASCPFAWPSRSWRASHPPLPCEVPLHAFSFGCRSSWVSMYNLNQFRDIYMRKFASVDFQDIKHLHLSSTLSSLFFPFSPLHTENSGWHLQPCLSSLSSIGPSLHYLSGSAETVQPKANPPVLSSRSAKRTTFQNPPTKPSCTMTSIPCR